jgi:membrane protein implicated in regulation of membrane protease activity
MNSKKSLTFFIFLFPVTFVVGILISIAYSLRYHETPGINWWVVMVSAIVLDLAFTWFTRRDFKDNQKQG